MADNLSRPDWFILVDESENPDIERKVWVHVSDAMDFCVEDVQYGYGLEPIPDTVFFDDVEEYLGPRPLECGQCGVQMDSCDC